MVGLIDQDGSLNLFTPRQWAKVRGEKSCPSSDLVSDLPKEAVNSSPEEPHSRTTVGTSTLPLSTGFAPFEELIGFSCIILQLQLCLFVTPIPPRRNLDLSIKATGPRHDVFWLL